MNRALVTQALDSIGRDTQTARLVAAKDYQGAYEWIVRKLEPHRWTTQTTVGGKQALGDQQQRTNAPRAAAYLSLRDELAKHLGIEGEVK